MAGFRHEEVVRKMRKRIFKEIVEWFVAAMPLVVLSIIF